jgi:hypothetical protein
MGSGIHMNMAFNIFGIFIYFHFKHHNYYQGHNLEQKLTRSLIYKKL